MTQNLLKKCILIAGLLLFFNVYFPIPYTNASLVAQASSVEETQSEIKLNVRNKALVKDTTFTLKIYNLDEKHKVSYKTASGQIAAVDDKGVITAVDFGTTVITVTVKDGFKTIATLDCEITVGPPALSVKLTKSEITLEIGKRTTLTTILKPNNTVEEAKFSSNDSEIASVSTGGRVTARSVGVTYVFAYIDNGKYDLCKVTVVESDPSGDEQDQDSKNTENKDTSSKETAKR